MEKDGRRTMCPHRPPSIVPSRAARERYSRAVPTRRNAPCPCRRRRRRRRARALVAAEDTVCRVLRAGGVALLEDIRTGRSLPAPSGIVRDHASFSCRLVEYRGCFVPAAADVIEDPENPSRLKSQAKSAEIAAGFLRELGIELLSPRKGIAFGDALKRYGAVPIEAYEEDDETPPVP